MKATLRVAALLSLCCAWAAHADSDPITLSEAELPPSARTLLPSPDDPAIGYFGVDPSDRVAQLGRQITSGAVHLTSDPQTGYLRALLDSLGVSIDAQVLVYSKTSLQKPFIGPDSPRAIFFSDDVVVAYIPGAPLIEVVAHDPQRGTIFYTVDQTGIDASAVKRKNECLSCHISRASAGVAGMLNRSVATADNGGPQPWIANNITDHRSPIAERWGGYYVAGVTGAGHMGNPNPPSADAAKYLSVRSDAGALMVFNHQMHMMNLLTRLGWDARVALSQQDKRITPRATANKLIASDVRELVDYLLFVDEAPIAGEFAPSSFTQSFSARGPRDKKERSFYQLDLKGRLLRYPCSYMIYSAAFDALPPVAKDAVFQRMWKILSGQDPDSRYQKLSRADRRAIIDILRETKPGLPTFFR